MIVWTLGAADPLPGIGICVGALMLLNQHKRRPIGKAKRPKQQEDHMRTLGFATIIAGGLTWWIGIKPLMPILIMVLGAALTLYTFVKKPRTN